MSDNWKRTTRQTIVELHQGGESYREMAGRLSAETGQGIPHHWLFDIARGKSSPTRKLAHALGVATEQDNDRVRFGVWMTRAERDELLQQIAANGMTRAEWVRAGGVTLDNVSASTARHVLAGVAEIAIEGIA